MSIPLDTPHLQDGIRSTHFFNGRLLSGEDLSQEQSARGEWLKLLGRSIGEGIVHGLEVSAPLGASSKEDPAVVVGPGLALNREGQALELRNAVTVSLAPARKSQSEPPPGSGEFHDCTPSANISVSGTGLFLLTLAPDKGYEGRAPVSGLGPNEPACNRKQLVEGVRFRLHRLELEASRLELSNPNDQHLRNRVAHLCFGTKDARRLGALVHPFGDPPKGYGLLDDHRSDDKLTGSEVPLAVLLWRESSGIDFMDMGSVRRRPTRVEHTGRWAPWLGERRVSEAEAVLLQFQEHLEALLRGSQPHEVKALDYFDYLPPAGVLPLQLGSLPGFTAERFFEGLTWRKHVIEGAHLESLLRQSLAHPPIELAQDELLWVYLIRENQQEALSGDQGVQPYLVFTSGHLPYLGDARADVARVEYAHLALPRPGEEPPAR